MFLNSSIGVTVPERETDPGTLLYVFGSATSDWGLLGVSLPVGTW